MEKLVPQQVKISIQEFPKYILPIDKTEAIPSIAEHLQRILSKYLETKGQSIVLPSLSILADFFKGSYLEMYDAIHVLRSQGYDYHFNSLDGGIMVWKT